MRILDAIGSAFLDLIRKGGLQEKHITVGMLESSTWMMSTTNALELPNELRNAYQIFVVMKYLPILGT